MWFGPGGSLIEKGIMKAKTRSHPVLYRNGFEKHTSVILSNHTGQE